MRLVAVLLPLLLAATASDPQTLVFRKDSPYKGAALEVVSYEEKDGRLFLTVPSGDLFIVPAGTVDWERSRQLTGQKRRQAQEQEEKRAAEAERRAAATAAQQRQDMGVVEASRRYGVDKPGMSVVGGEEGAAAGPAPPVAPVAPAAGGQGDAATELAALARKRLEELQGRREALVKEIEQLRQDRNPDPQWVAKRDTRLAERQQDLADLDRRIAELQSELGAAEKAARAGG